jgi:hypothetical protein
VPGRTAINSCIRARFSSTIRSSRPMISPGQYSLMMVVTRRLVSGPNRSAGK